MLHLLFSLYFRSSSNYMRQLLKNGAPRHVRIPFLELHDLLFPPSSYVNEHDCVLVIQRKPFDESVVNGEKLPKFGWNPSRCTVMNVSKYFIMCSRYFSILKKGLFESKASCCAVCIRSVGLRQFVFARNLGSVFQPSSQKSNLQYIRVSFIDLSVELFAALLSINIEHYFNTLGTQSSTSKMKTQKDSLIGKE